MTIKSSEQVTQPGDEGKAPLSGKWRHNNRFIFNGTLRILRADCDTNPADEFVTEVMDWIVKRLNPDLARSVAPVPDAAKAAEEINRRIAAIAPEDRESRIAEIISQHCPTPSVEDAIKVGELRQALKEMQKCENGMCCHCIDLLVEQAIPLAESLSVAQPDKEKNNAE